MEILLAIFGLLVVILSFLFVKSKRENRKLQKENDEIKQQAIFLSKKDIEFLEFAADMYVKYSFDLKIHSPEQHEFIIAELERIRTILQDYINS